MREHPEGQQPWVTCFLTNILIRHLEETTTAHRDIDYGSLFRSAHGFDIPPDPGAYLKDINNWVPLPVLRELHGQCERLSGKKDFAYHAARVYFDPKKKQLPSLFEIIAHVLNDVRSLLICADLWASVQTNYLTFQSFEGANRDLYMLAQFGENSRPNVGSMHFLRGICEGFIRLCAFIEDVKCVEELSQLTIEDIVREFPASAAIHEGHRLVIRHPRSPQPVVEAIKIALKTEVVSLSKDFSGAMPDAIVVPPREGRITVMTRQEETDAQRKARAPSGYKIVKAGILSHGSLTYAFQEGDIYNAPYSRIHFLCRERPSHRTEVPGDTVSRRDVSRLLFGHLKQAKETQTRMIQHNIEKRELTLENVHLRREIAREYSLAGIVGHNRKMQDLSASVRSIAETDVTVLIHGETGTGKELIARAIHYNSPRRTKRFVAINCGSLTETLLESELFGHERGAFTGAIAQRKGIFETADGGTLLLDEIGEIPTSTQVKLLRVLQEGEFQRVGGSHTIKVDVRIVAATNQNLEDLISAGRFRQDLYYRINVVPLRVPPLRERLDDIPLLITHFMEKFTRKMPTRLTGVSSHAMTLLMAYTWPGNVRELENIIQRMMVVASGEILDLQDLPPEIRGGGEPPREPPKDLKGVARESAGLVEKRVILDALTTTRWNVTQAARALGISRATLYNKIKTYGLEPPTG